MCNRLYALTVAMETRTSLSPGCNQTHIKVVTSMRQIIYFILTTKRQKRTLRASHNVSLRTPQCICMGQHITKKSSLDPPLDSQVHCSFQSDHVQCPAIDHVTTQTPESSLLTVTSWQHVLKVAAHYAISPLLVRPIAETEVTVFSRLLSDLC